MPVKRAWMICAAIMTAGSGTAAMPRADLELVAGTVSEVDGCLVYTDGTCGSDLVMLEVACDKAELANPEWTNENGMGIGRGDCVDFKHETYCVDWVAPDHGAGLSRLDDTHPQDWRILRKGSSGPAVEVARAATRHEAQATVTRLPDESWRYWIRRE